MLPLQPIEELNREIDRNAMRLLMVLGVTALIGVVAVFLCLLALGYAAGDFLFTAISR